MSNVAVPVANPPDGETGFSTVYDGDPSDPLSLSFGRIAFTPPEASLPGIKIEGGKPSDDPQPDAEGNYPDGISPYVGTQKQSFDGCIMTSSDAYCNSEFQSGKRVKQQITGIGPIDLVFGVADPNPDADDDPSLYQVFHRLINVTGTDLSGFSIELGTGIGGDFIGSTVEDGLRFAVTNLEGNPLSFGPDGQTSFSQYPFGLFGGDPLNPNPLGLKGFFDIGNPPDDNGRAGFDVAQGVDRIDSGAFYGIYDDMFGNWLSQNDVPEGLFWDYADGQADPLLMAWLNGDGKWELRRDIADGVIGVDGLWGMLGIDSVLSLSSAEWQLFAKDNEQGVAEALGLAGLVRGAIEDLANLNLSFGIELDDYFVSDLGNSNFTLRVTPIAPVPLPAGAPMLIAGLLALGAASRRWRPKA